MAKQILSQIFVLLLFIPAFLSAQQQDPLLFTVDNTPVQASEFEYIYAKTNGDKADFSRESLQEYLDLYVTFKLKVQQAKDMKLDTIPSLQRELAGYRQQLANSYLVDKEVTQHLVDEAYQRTKKEVDISHIMVSLSPNASSLQERKALDKINSLYAMLQSGDSFEEVAKQHSEDTYSKDKGGKLGYFVAMFRPGFYEMETAAYSLKKGQYSKPVRTIAGYHIIKLNDTRPARGEIEVAHILVRNKKDKRSKKETSLLAKAKIDSLYNLLKSGISFEAVAKAHSEDKSSKDKGGVVGPLTTNSPVDTRFKDVAFALTKDGEYSKPFESSVGWHIVRRISKKAPETEEIAKRRLLSKMQKGNKKRRGTKKFSRQQIAKDAMLQRIKKEGGFKEDINVFHLFTSKLDSTFLSHKWKKPSFEKDLTLISFANGMKTTINDFADFAKRSSLRMRQRDKSEITSTAKEIYKQFVEEQCIKYEETQLEKKYPEFKSLMREYEEGILLFEVTKLLVWDKASQDSLGLATFFENNKDKYKWDERAEVTTYTIPAGKENLIEPLRKMAAKKHADKVKEKYKDEGIAINTKLYEKGKSKKLENLIWKAGAITKATLNPKNKSTSFMKIEKILPPQQKELKDARGYVIADYQDFLEKQWIEDLKKQHKVKINQEVLDALIKNKK
ncbi:MAG TPA: peptidyl-prolyl cis-trans isomerase [Phaeodactylibacter sp.]|nr:peptidyl-prolyl cis-trans isomerase [Phaeodactylibacter sp.]